RTDVPIKYRFPYFEKMCWFAGRKYYNILKENPKSLSTWEEKGIVELALFLLKLSSKLESNGNASSEERQLIQSSIPEGISDHSRFARRLCRRINNHINEKRFREKGIDTTFISSMKNNVIDIKEDHDNEHSNSPESKIETPKNLRLRIVSKKRNYEDVTREQDSKSFVDEAEVKCRRIDKVDNSRDITMNEDLNGTRKNQSQVDMFLGKGSPLTPLSDSTISSWNEECIDEIM
ncbi:88_t:CDS:2, partial [Acaulospora morrowiae]